MFVNLITVACHRARSPPGRDLHTWQQLTAHWPAVELVATVKPPRQLWWAATGASRVQKKSSTRTKTTRPRAAVPILVPKVKVRRPVTAIMMTALLMRHPKMTILSIAILALPVAMMARIANPPATSLARQTQAPTTCRTTKAIATALTRTKAVRSRPPRNAGSPISLRHT